MLNLKTRDEVLAWLDEMDDTQPCQRGMMITSWEVALDAMAEIGRRAGLEEAAKWLLLV